MVIQEEREKKWSAEDKEAQLQADAMSWENANPQKARDGDIPIIDVSTWFEAGDSAELKKLGDALRISNEQVGFYQLVGHGLQKEDLDEILDQNRRFHALPDSTKHELRMDQPSFPIGGVGYLPYGNWKLPARSNPNQNAAFLIKHSHDVSFNDNLWPRNDQVPGFRSAVERYAVSLQKLCKRILPIYAVSLDLTTDHFDEAFREPFYRLRLSHYRSSDGKGGFGIHPHVDTSFITLLLTDGTPGLNIFSHRRNEWIQMPTSTEPNALIVNSGELLRQWSNDRCLSTRHFVVNYSEATDRYSVPFFYTPNSDFKMACLPTCWGPGNPAKYPPLSYKESQAKVQGE